jgi:alkylhydroperoxidase family enzyme
MTAAASSTPRLAPLPAAEWDEGAREMLRGRLRMADRYLADDPDAPPLPNVLGLLGHHAELGGAWLAYNGVLLDRPLLDARHRELVILRVAWRARSHYEWAQHARMALGLGFSRAQLEAIGRGPDDPIWDGFDRLLLRATDQLVDRHRLDDATWAELASRFDTRELLEFLFVAGSYLCLAMVFNSVALQPDPESDPDSIPELAETEE